MLNYIKVLDDSITFELTEEPQPTAIHYLDISDVEIVNLYYNDIMKLEKDFTLEYRKFLTPGTIIYVPSKTVFAEWILEHVSN